MGKRSLKPKIYAVGCRLDLEGFQALQFLMTQSDWKSLAWLMRHTILDLAGRKHAQLAQLTRASDRADQENITTVGPRLPELSPGERYHGAPMNPLAKGFRPHILKPSAPANPLPKLTAVEDEQDY